MRTVVVMSGGGGRGCFEIGAVKYILESGIKPDAYYGTSVGALNSMALGLKGIEYAEKVWDDVAGSGDILNLNFIFGLPFQDGLYNTKALRDKLDAVVESVTTPLAEVVVCYNDTLDGSIQYKSSIDTPIKDMAKWAQASASMPVIMNLVDGRYCDGGVRQVTPLKKAIADGADRIIVVLASPITQNLPGSWTPTFPKLLSVALRTADILVHQVFLTDLKSCTLKNSIPGYKRVELITIAPAAELADTLDFSAARIQADKIAGYEAAKAVMG